MHGIYLLQLNASSHKERERERMALCHATPCKIDPKVIINLKKIKKMISKSQAYPIPRLSDIFDVIGEANTQLFTSLDSGKAFWQV